MNLRSKWDEIKESSNMYQKLEAEEETSNYNRRQLDSGKNLPNSTSVKNGILDKFYDCREIGVGVRFSIISYLLRNQLGYGRFYIDYENRHMIIKFGQRVFYDSIRWLEENNIIVFFYMGRTRKKWKINHWTDTWKI